MYGIHDLQDPLPLENATYYANSNASEELCAYFKTYTGGNIKRVKRVKVLVIGYDNDRPLKPDVENLKSTYSKFGWPMLVLTNADTESLFDFLGNKNSFEKYMRIGEEEKVDLLIIHILAHGNANGVICTHLKEVFCKEDIFEMLNWQESCRNNRKIFIPASCRGNKMEKRFQACSQFENVYQEVAISTPQFVRMEDTKENTTFFFSTVEGHFSNHDSDGTHVIKAWCDILNFLNKDASLEIVLTDVSGQVVARSRSNVPDPSTSSLKTFAQTPVAHFSQCDRLLFFGKICQEHKKPACDCTSVATTFNIDPPPTKKMIDFSKIKKPGWYGDLNENGRRRGPGKVFILHQEVIESDALKLEKCFKENFPHLGLQKTCIKRGESISNEFTRIAGLLDDEYMVLVFLLEELKCEGVKYYGERLEEYIRPFLVENCPTMCGIPKAFYVLYYNPRWEYTSAVGTVKQANQYNNTGHNHSDILCCITRNNNYLNNSTVDILVDTLSANREDLLEEKTNLLDVLTFIANSEKCYSRYESHLPIIISSLPKRLSFLDVKPIYLEPIFQQEHMRMDRSTVFDQNCNYNDIIKSILETVRTQETKSAVVVCADTGTGKTSFGKEVSKFLKDNRVVVIHINAKEHERVLTNNMDVNQIFAQILKGKEVIPSKAALIIDAIDEICPLKRKHAVSFLERIFEAFLFVLVTTQSTEEKDEILETLRNSDVRIVKFKNLTEFETDTFMKMFLKDVPCGMETWETLRQQVNFSWTPQLLTMVAEIIRNQESSTTTSQTFPLTMFNIYLSVFNMRIRKSQLQGEVLNIKIAHLKAAIGYQFGGGQPIDLTQEERHLIERVGLASFEKERLKFTHYSWVHFLLCLALMAPEGILEESMLSLNQKAFILNTLTEVLEFLDQAIEADFVDEHFQASNFFGVKTLAKYLQKTSPKKFLTLVLRRHFCGIYFKFVIKHLLKDLKEKDSNSTILHNLLYVVCCSLESCSQEREPRERIALDLCKRGADVNKLFKDLDLDENRELLVRSLARFNNYNILRSLILEVSNKAYWTSRALLVAVEFGQVESVNALLEIGADIHQESIHKYELIVSPWSSFPRRTEGGPLHIAAYFGSRDVFTFLLSKPGIHINLPSKMADAKTPLHFAAESGQVQMVKWLLDQKAINPKAVDKKGWNALHLAVHREDAEVIEVLLKRGFDINATTHLGENIFHLAGDKKHVAIVDMLLRNGVDIYQKKELKTTDPDTSGFTEGWTALHYAVYLQHTKLIKRILEEKVVEVDAKDASGKTALHWASSPETVHLLLEAKADVNAVEHMEKTPLQEAVEMLNVKVAERLLKERSLDVNHKCKTGKNALHIILGGRSRDHRYFQILRLLLQREDIDVLERTEEGETPLEIATDLYTLDMLRKKISPKN